MKPDHKILVVLKKFETPQIKITLEETYQNHFIATRWLKASCPEAERTVFKYKTFEAAIDKAFDLVVAVATQKEKL